MNRRKKILSVILSVVMLLSTISVLSLCTLTATAEGAYTAGIEIKEASEENLKGEYGEAYAAAGYQITYTYIVDEGEDVVGIDLWGDFQWYSPESVQTFADNGYSGYATASSAYQYREGFTASGYGSPIAAVSAEENIYGVEGLYSTRNGYIFYPMAEVADGVFQLTMPIPAGQYRYAYRLYASDGSAIQVRDPAEDVDWYVIETYNPSPAYWSYFLVGSADEVTQNQEIIYNATDEAHRGTVVKDEIETPLSTYESEKQQIQIYLPYNYDKNSEEPYKVLYVSHGSSENEDVYMSFGSVPAIMDNLIAKGAITDHVIVVTMDNARTFCGKAYGDSVRVAQNIVENLIPYIAENYNGSTAPEDLALCGSSAGGKMTATALQYFSDSFSAYGIFSAPMKNFSNLTEEQTEAIVSVYEAGGLYIGGGNIERKETSETLSLYANLVAMGCSDLEYDMVPGAHDFLAWHQTFTNFALFLDWTDEIIDVEADSEVAVGDTITINVTTTSNVVGFYLENESGAKVTISSVSKTVDEYGKLVWTIKTSVGTSGNRILTLTPASEITGVGEGVEINITVSDRNDAYDVISASFAKKAVVKNTPVELNIKSGNKVSSITVTNESDSKIGKTLISKTRNSNGTIDWSYSMKIGTAGKSRTFSVISANGTVAVDASIAVVD